MKLLAAGPLVGWFIGPLEGAVTLAEYEEEKIVCPKCGSRKLNQRVTAFYAVTSKKSA